MGDMGLLILIIGIGAGLCLGLGLYKFNSLKDKLLLTHASKARAGTPTNPVEFDMYKSKNVGNDASARPWESELVEPELALGPGPFAPQITRPHYSSVPVGFQLTEFVDTAKSMFMTMQEAWDKVDMPALRLLLAPQMFEVIGTQMSSRMSEGHKNGQSTDVINLQAEVLGVHELDQQYLASVEFSGLIREDLTQGPSSFREAWSFVKFKTPDATWQVLGVENLV